MTVSDGDLAASCPPCQVVYASSVEGQERTGKDSKKGLERFRDAPDLPNFWVAGEGAEFLSHANAVNGSVETA